MFSVLKLALAAFAALPVIVGAHMGVQQLIGNFHEVIPGVLYRSAQPDGGDIASYARKYGIKTILNLRDEPHGAWYDEEVAAAKLAGIQLIDHPMSSSKILPIADSEELAEIMRNAPKPLLIHCEHGANRTGLASAIYVGAVAGKSEFASEFQLSPYYGNVPIKGVGRYQMYQSWDRFEETIGF